MHCTLEGNDSMVKFNPISLTGKWKQGYALDFHTVKSEFLGYDDLGHKIFETHRTDIGELLYRLKYKADKSVIDQITEAAVCFIKNTWKISDRIQIIISIPPSNTHRKFQPVSAVASSVALQLGIELCDNSVMKVKDTLQIKNIPEYQKRLELLREAFTVDISKITGKTILLFDDLYRSGATANAISDTIHAADTIHANDHTVEIYYLSLTRTRTIR